MLLPIKIRNYVEIKVKESPRTQRDEEHDLYDEEACGEVNFNIKDN